MTTDVTVSRIKLKKAIMAGMGLEHDMIAERDEYWGS